MLVVSSPSGAGKTTLTRNLLARRTERRALGFGDDARAAPERDRRRALSFHRSQARFERCAKAGELLEWAEVHGNCYGTPRAPVEAALAAGRDMLFDIDWQGTRQLRRRCARDIVSVFVLPPSAAELETAAAEARAEDSARSSRGAWRNAAEEMRHWNEYDHVLINDDLDRASRRARSILASASGARARRADMEDFVAKLLADLRRIAA